MTVVAAVKLDDAISTGETSCKSDRTHRRFGPGIHQPDLFNGWNELADQFRQFHLTSCRRAERSANLENFLEGAKNFRLAMSEKERPPRTDIVDVLIAIDIPYSRSFRSGHKHRFTANGS